MTLPTFLRSRSTSGVRWSVSRGGGAPARVPGREVAALESLPSRMRAVIVLRYDEDLSEADTAAALGRSVPGQASRGLARLCVEVLPACELMGSREDAP